MVRRSTPQWKTDEIAFPIRVRFEVPGRGFGNRLNDLHRWLRDTIGPGNYAVHSSSGLATDGMAVHLRIAEDANAVVLAFPDFQLADGVASVAYSSPYKQPEEEPEMCNLYSMMKGQDAIRALFDGIDDRTGNLPPLPGIYPNYSAPVVTQSAEGRVLEMMRWGMPSPVFALKGKNYDRGITNVRNTKSPHWRRWLGVENRCLVPFTSFAEPGHDKKNVWFALDENRPLGFFAGVLVRDWTSVRKVKDGETTDNLFGFLTTDANAEVGAIHPKAMPVILTNPDEMATWLEADAATALELQRTLPDGSLQLVPEDGEQTR